MGTAYRVIALFRILLLVLLVLLGLVAGVFSGFLSTSKYMKVAALWHHCVAKTVGVRCRFSGADFEQGALIVCNHVSWLDISVIGSRFPVVFLANSVIMKWPVLGWVIKKAGTLFIEKGSGAAKAITDLGNSLRNHQSVLIFPEGRTTDGTGVIRFQPRLFQSAIDAGARVQAIGIRYVDAAGVREPRPRFDGDITLIQSVWAATRGKPFYVEVHLFDPILANARRDALSRETQRLVRGWVENPPGPAAGPKPG